MNKKEIRKLIKQRINDTDNEYFNGADLHIFKSLAALPEFESAEVLYLYNSIPKEVSTEDIISTFSGKKTIYLPTVIGADIKFSKLDDNSTFITNSWGIAEPVVSAHETDELISENAVCIMPLLGFSAERERLGRGKGYYDRFLTGNKMLKIALAYDIQEVGCGFSEAHDVKPDIIVTESRVIR